MTEATQAGERKPPVKVILDTDIGDDIDDTWALAMLLGLPERVDLSLVVTNTGDTTEKARLATRILHCAGRSDIPVAIGLGRSDDPHNQTEWVGQWDIADFSGTVIEDGPGAIIDAVNARPGSVILAIGPQTNLEAALQRDSSIASRARVVAMAGGVYRGYGGSRRRDAEYNIKADIPAARAVLAAPWQKTWTPLDTCGTVKLSGRMYRQVADSTHALSRIVIENYEAWARRLRHPTLSSSVLFDTVAAYLTFDESLLKMETVNISINDDGHTLPEPHGSPVRCALEWRDREAFERLLAGALTGQRL